MTALPQGTVTFLFTDVEGSTRLLHELGAAYAGVLEEHRSVLRAAFARHHGVEVDTQGDAFFVAFEKASDALAATRDAQAALAEGRIRVRMGVHTGEPTATDSGYVGIDVHRAARIAAAGHGGQILVSQSTHELLGDDDLRDLGEHRLKDLAAPERIYQLGDGDFPPLKSLNNSNLPLPAEPLIGRKKELADVLRQLRDGVRLVTVTGPGGSGKTRFALEVAAELVEHFRDGVWWVGLAPVRDARLVVPTIATVVGAKRALAPELRGKELLLLLDNFEQVADAAPNVAEIQRTCPGVAALVTSREPLHIAGEHEYPLAPLPESPAVELFRQRAEAVDPGFEGEYRDLRELCDRVDRLPLAIELAAARVKVLPVNELLSRLEQRLPLLTSRRRDVEERQRTLCATIEWSYDLLDVAAQDLFRRLSVFAGRFDVAAAEHVGECELEVLHDLVDKSLLRADSGWFYMLETLREFSTDRLRDAGARDVIYERLVEYLLALAREADEQKEQQVARFRVLSAQLPSIRAALAWAEEGHEVAGLQLVGALYRFWSYAALTEEAGRWTEALWVGDVPVELQKQALRTLALAAMDCDSARLREVSQRRLELAEATGDVLEAGGALSGLATAAWDEGEEGLDRARRLYEASVAKLLEAGDTEAAARMRSNLGIVARAQGDYSLAREIFEEELRLTRAAHIDTEVAWSLWQLAVTAFEEGSADEARERWREVLERLVDLGYEGLIAQALVGIAAVAVETDVEGAAKLLGAAEAYAAVRGEEGKSADWSVMKNAAAAAEGALGRERFEALREAGAALEESQAIQLARRYLD